MRRGRYFRIVADVFVDSKSLGDILINNSLAVVNDSSRSKDWCR